MLDHFAMLKKHLRASLMGLLSSVALFPSVSLAAADAPLIVRYEHPLSEQDKRWIYYVDLLKLALDYEAEDKPYKLERAPITMVQSRAVQAVADGKHIDLMWGVTSPQREKKMHPIRIPLLKGLLGYRVFIIHREEQLNFAQIETLQQLKLLKVGQGRDWSDTKILRLNDFNVLTTSSYEALFTMLAGKRFDFFPRSVYEAHTEASARPQLQLMVEPKLMLKYTSPTFFFTSKKNPKLSKRLEEGLRRAISDGSFDKHFFNHPLTQPIFDKVKLKDRIAFELANPLLTEATAETLKDPTLWYTP